MKIYTIGHSTRTLEDFIDILKHFGIELVVDVRKFPSSKKFPHFDKENLETELLKIGIRYLHYPELGGFRKGGYEAFTQTEEFNNAINKFLEIVDGKITVILCAEVLFWRCHRKYIANKLSELGHQIIHIFTKDKTQEHKLRTKEIDEKMKLKIFCDKVKE
jgi:uncharacterized protein (DUF488 family)